MDAIVIGNTTLDVLCYPVDDVPRRDSLLFDQVLLAPGGCGSNVAIGLGMLGVPTGLVTVISDDIAYDVVQRYWQRAGLDTRFVRQVPSAGPAVSIGLVDSEFQPRFIHTTGPNRMLTSLDLDISQYASTGARALMVAGFYVLPGLLDGNLASALHAARQRGMTTLLDVTNSRRMDDHLQALWDCLPLLDYFLCNTLEARRLTGLEDPAEICAAFRQRSVDTTLIVKLGAQGCWVDGPGMRQRIPGLAAHVVDTTGAGDAFAAGLIAALLRSRAAPSTGALKLAGDDLAEACAAANAAGARIVTRLGAISAWFEQ